MRWLEVTYPNSLQEAVPQLNLRAIKKKHRDRKESQESLCKSPEEYVTAREDQQEAEQDAILRVDMEEMQQPGVTGVTGVTGFTGLLIQDPM